MPSHASLDAAAQERKNRLAQLKSLKRKEPPTPSGDGVQQSQDHDRSNAAEGGPASTEKGDVTSAYLSGRNYDVATRGPRLGFEQAPDSRGVTLEEKAAAIANETREKATKEESAEKPLDLFALQPKKPNWDLKRDLQKKLDVLDVRTNEVIARLVRERIEEQLKRKKESSTGKKNGNDVGGEQGEVDMDGKTLVEVMHAREREDEEDARRERAADSMDL